MLGESHHLQSRATVGRERQSWAPAYMNPSLDTPQLSIQPRYPKPHIAMGPSCHFIMPRPKRHGWGIKRQASGCLADARPRKLWMRASTTYTMAPCPVSWSETMVCKIEQQAPSVQPHSLVYTVMSDACNYLSRHVPILRCSTPATCQPPRGRRVCIALRLYLPRPPLSPHFLQQFYQAALLLCSPTPACTPRVFLPLPRTPPRSTLGADSVCTVAAPAATLTANLDTTHHAPRTCSRAPPNSSVLAILHRSTVACRHYAAASSISRRLSDI